MFSETVDKVIARSGRPEKQAEAVVAVRNALKKAHSQEYFAKDLHEFLQVSTEENFTWTLPRNFRAMHTVRYGIDTYPRNLQPGKIQDGVQQFWYQAGQYIVFSGVGTDTNINLAFYKSNRKFKYYPVGERPAVWDDEAEVWTYLQGDGTYGPSLATPDLEEAAVEKVSSWLLDEWTELAEEGALASIYKMIGDERTRTHFSNYNQLLGTLEATESVTGLHY